MQDKGRKISHTNMDDNRSFNVGRDLIEKSSYQQRGKPQTIKREYNNPNLNSFKYKMQTSIDNLIL